jgi:hypothetical protein
MASPRGKKTSLWVPFQTISAKRLTDVMDTARDSGGFDAEIPHSRRIG